MRTSDDELRQGRLVFYTQDVGRLDGELDGFLEFSGARCAILIDREGHLVTRRGDAAVCGAEGDIGGEAPAIDAASTAEEAC